MNFSTAGHFAAMASLSQLLLIFFRNRLLVSANRSGVKDCFCYIGTYIVLIISCGTAYVLYCVHTVHCTGTTMASCAFIFLSQYPSLRYRSFQAFLFCVTVGIPTELIKISVCPRVHRNNFFLEKWQPYFEGCKPISGSYAYFVESSAI